MPKASSSRLRAAARTYAAEHGIGYRQAHAAVTTPTSQTPTDTNAEAAKDKYEYRIVDARNQGWLHDKNGIYHGFDNDDAMPRPLTDEQLAELAVQPGYPTLDIEQVAAIVAHLPSGPRARFAERLGTDDVPLDRVRLIIERIETEKAVRYGHECLKFDLERQRKLLELRPLAEIERHFGPCRPVCVVTQADEDELRAAFGLAGRKLITSLASAIELVHHEACGQFPEDSAPWNAVYYARRTLIAGRPGSWESVALLDIVPFGNELNLYPRKDELPPDARRQTGPNPKRVHVDARDQIAAVLRRWTGAPDRYTEVAETLAWEVSHYADETHGAGGWAKIADQWLQPNSMAAVNFRNCYRLFYSQSEHFDTEAI
jgi:hypothetical protein